MRSRWLSVFVLVAGSIALVPGSVSARPGVVAPVVARPPTRSLTTRILPTLGEPRREIDAWPVTTPITRTCYRAPRGLVGWWPGDGTPLDFWGNNHGTLENGATYGPGEVAQAFQFDGSDDDLALPPGLIYTHTVLSFETWFNSTGNGIILGYQDTAYPTRPLFYYQPAIYVGTDGKLRAEFYQDQARPITTASPVNDGQWHHLALVANVDQQGLFLDGVLVGGLSGRLNGHTQMYNQIGMGWSGVWPSGTNNWMGFNGRIDEPSLYYRALSAAEIQTIYNAGPDGKCKIPTYLFVQAIDAGYRPIANEYVITATVTLQDTRDFVDVGAFVLLDVTEPDGSTLTYRLRTNAQSTASLTFGTGQAGTYTFTVQNVSEPGRIYAPGHNVETSDSITIPGQRENHRR